jgi:hypothetical protein
MRDAQLMRERVTADVSGEFKGIDTATAKHPRGLLTKTRQRTTQTIIRRLTKGPNKMNIVKRGIHVNEAASAAEGLTARQTFLNRSRFGGHDSAEEQQLEQVTTRNALIGADGVPEPLPAEAALARMTNSPPGWGRQVPTPTPPPMQPGSQAAPQAPSAAEAIARGVTAPPYAPMRGRELAMFRARWGRDPLPGETMTFAGGLK